LENRLGYERPVCLEDLDPVVPTIADINESVIREFGTGDRPELLS
jgi:hypothetical protein